MVFYTVKIVYTCVFMTCSISCPFDTIMDPWNADLFLCLYVNESEKL